MHPTFFEVCMHTVHFFCTLCMHTFAHCATRARYVRVALCKKVCNARGTLYKREY